MRKIGSESEARRQLAAVKASGKSLKEFARTRGLDGRSLHAWKMNLERAVATPKRAERRTRSTTHAKSSVTQLVELVPAPSGARYVVRVERASIELGDDFDADTLRRLLDVLAC